jgi:RNA polymerase sigma-70 factor (ECF subfamily)
MVSKHQDRLFNTLVHIAGSREEAEDVSQEAFVQAFIKLDTFAGKSAFYTWLYRIAFNIMASRRRRKRPEVSLDVGRDFGGDEPMDRTEPAATAIERAERADQLHAALAELTTEHRSILVLREMEGHDYETISDVLDLPVGTVRSRLHRARSQLRERLRHVLQQQSS